ncbi:DUF3488 and transglutaminase-like domain-containing protein [Actinocorallia sp. API 0066]|uniref:transglutaminase family protein n=1 Tax=Actinocorallia sp. API 0066 TaxID=2896846 RepID=UPI001E5C39CC|nr:DUF3488 and transglutaminase-like domain-containing protein [Actinocorallia sp. API 0066]MCD0450860.1 DUF3488 and transglutaminase-like domain-containing protein [Actinocorallia sp. API 0066]
MSREDGERRPRPVLAVASAAATALAATSLAPLFQDRSWVLPTLGAILVVAGAGALVRRFRVPPVFTLVGSIAALHLYLTAVFTGSQALLWVIPTADSIEAMLALLRDGRHTAETYAAPLPVGDGVRIMTAYGVGFVAAAVDLLAVRLRKAAPAGLPLLALYSVPAAVRTESVSWVAFALGAGGYLTLLALEARDRVTAWGRVVPSSFGRFPSVQGSAETFAPRVTAGKRVGVASIAVAVAIPALVPGLGATAVFDFGGKGSGGSTTITTADPLVDLKRKLTNLGDAEVLRYRTTAADPDYLRIFALDVFEDDRWTYSALASGAAPKIDGGTLPRVPGLTVSAYVDSRTEITVAPKVRDMKFLALPYAPREIDIEGDAWRADRQSLMVFSTGADADGLTYTVDSRRATPTPGQLRRASPAGLGRYTDVPRLPQEVITLTEQVTGKARTKFDKAVALQRWFNREFTYSLEPPPPTSLSDLTAFLHDRRGYCEQFAATMALMTRLLNIPTRVVVGYAPGTWQADGTYLVRQRDAHAWPELYFEGAGWVRFEPTPGGTGAPSSVGSPEYTRPQTQTPENDGSEEGPETPEPTASAEETPSAAPTETAAATDPERTQGADEDGALPVGWIIGALLLVLLAGSPRLVRAALLRLRWGPAADPASAAWAQLRGDALDYGLGWQVAESPRAVIGRLGRRLGPDAAEPLARIALARELSRYAPPGALPPQGGAGLRGDTRAVRAAMDAAATRPARVRASLLPASSLDAVRRAWEAARDRLPRRAGREDTDAP